jgi:hypothetical protein
MSDTTIKQVIAGLLDIRARREVLRNSYKEQDAKLVEAEERGENWLLAKLQELGVDNVKTDVGTAFTQVKQRASIGDWNALVGFIKETGEVDILQHRINETNLKTVVESRGGELPPGVEISPVRTVTIRKA